MKETRKFIHWTDELLTRCNLQSGDLQKLAAKIGGELKYEDCPVEYTCVRTGELSTVRGWVIYLND